MRVSIAAVLLLAILFTSAPAWAAPTDQGKETRVNKCLRKGLESLSAARKAATTSRKLDLLDRALASLHRARGLRRIQGQTEKYAALDRSVERALIQTLNAKTRVYLDRGSLPQARRANRAALAYSVADTEALNLRTKIDEAWALDLYEVFEGQVSADRLRDNREEAGESARDRGAGRRR